MGEGWEQRGLENVREGVEKEVEGANGGLATGKGSRGQCNREGKPRGEDVREGVVGNGITHAQGVWWVEQEAEGEETRG